VSETTQSTAPGNEFLPPGAPDPNDTSVADYPAVTIVDEEQHKVQEDAATQERVERAKSVSSPKRLSSQEKLNIGVLLKLLPDNEVTTPIPMESLPEELRNSFFDVGSTKNLAQRGIVKLHTNAETKQIDSLSITDIAYEIYQSGKGGGPKQKRTTKADGTPKAPGGRTSSQFAGLRMRKLVDNPREEGTMGYFSWQLYQDGMSYKEYMACKDYPEQRSKRTAEVFRGPGRNHWDWDLMHGYIGLYRENEPELLEDGSPNPNYWAVNNSVR
jgi:hypothetical protein